MGRHRIRHLVERDGSFYFQATKTMRANGMASEALGTDYLTAAARAIELNALWDGIRGGSNAIDQNRVGTMGWLVDTYVKHRWYRDLSKKGRQEADTALRDIRDALGPAQIVTVRPRAVDAFIETLVKTRSADIARRRAKFLRRIMNLAIKMELIDQNPVVSLDIPGYKPRRTLWTSEDVASFIQASKECGLPNIGLAIQLCYDTCQRPSDVLRATWSDLDGGGLSFRQGKTDEPVWCPLETDTLIMLSETTRRSPTIVTTPSGLPYITYSYFSGQFRKVREAAGLSTELRVQDLRRTGATEINAGGGKIEPITGHKYGSPMTRVYIVPNRGAAKQAQAARRRGKSDKKV